MTISGFTFVRNATKLYYPIREAILSILPIVDEFVVALGNCDPDDRTREVILSIGSPKVRIVDTVWDTVTYPNGTENAHQTDIARSACTGDWLFYLQADEVVHERDLPLIKQRCMELLDDHEVEGLLFSYIHFWGDYQHHQVNHGWYQDEVRIVRNHPHIHSWESAQSFRRIPEFDGHSYRMKEGTLKIKVARCGAVIHHYGWVRPPKLMQDKRKALETVHKGKDKVDGLYRSQAQAFDYGPMRHTAEFKGTHPKVMADWMARFDWARELRYDGPFPTNRPPFKHEKMKYRLLSFFEQHFLGGRHIGPFRNYALLKDR